MSELGRWCFAGGETSLGLSSFLPRLLESNSVTEVELRTLTRGPSLQGRVQDDHVQQLAELAREDSRNRGVTFWVSMLVLAADESPQVRARLFQEALYHRTETDGMNERPMAASTFASRLTESGFQETDSRGITALTSVVHTRVGMRHIPLLDFRVSPSGGHAQLLTELLSILGARGYLVDSGRSYHFYGAETIAAEQYWGFLGRAQLMAPFIDERWIAHQLISGKAALRVSTNAERHVLPPRLVAWSSGEEPLYLQ